MRTDSLSSRPASRKGSSSVSSSSKLLPLVADMVRGRSFEGSLPLYELQVGGILEWHWSSWSFYGAKDWTVEGLHSWYNIPFHHCPPVLWEPSKLLSCSSGSAKAQAFQGEVDKLLEKGAFGLADYPGLSYYSQLLLKQKLMGARCVLWSTCWAWTGMSLLPSSAWQGLINTGVDLEGRLHVLDRPQGLLPHSPGLSTLSPDRSWRQGLPVQGTVFWPFVSSSGLHQGVRLCRLKHTMSAFAIYYTFGWMTDMKQTAHISRIQDSRIFRSIILFKDALFFIIFSFSPSVTGGTTYVL